MAMSFAEISWAAHSELPLLGLLQLFPLLAASMMLSLKEQRLTAPVALVAALVELGLAVKLYLGFDPVLPALQFAEHFHIFGPFAYHTGADGMTVLFMLLAALLGLLLVLYGTTRALAPLHRFFAVVFAGEAALMSLVATLDLSWFVLLSMLQLIPVGYLLWRWATSPDKNLALTRFLQFMGIGVLMLAAGATLLASHHHQETDRWSFDLLALAETPLPPESQALVFFLLFYGLAVRTPLFPMHGWLPRIAEHGSVAVAPVFLLGIKTGIYGLLRFVFPLTPDAVMYWQPYVVAFAVTGVFYAALLAYHQDNLRRLLSYAVVSHTGLLVIGLFSLDKLAFQGSLMLSVNFGLAIAGLFFMTGMVYTRTRSTRLPRLGGLFDSMPMIAITFLVAGLAIVGMPGTPGFDAAHLLLEAGMHNFGALLTIAAALGNVAAAGFLLWAFQRAFLAPPTVERSGIEPTKGNERLIALLMLAVLLGVGFWPEPWLELLDSATTNLGNVFDAQRQGGGH